MPQDLDVSVYGPCDVNVTPEFITWAYRIILQRNPESFDAINYWMTTYPTSKHEIIYGLLCSPEYKTNFSLLSAVKDSNFVNLQQIIFLHVPKSFGTSFRELLALTYLSDFAHVDNGLNFITSSPLLTVKVYAGHIGYETNNKAKKCLYLSVLREPVSRAISNYEHIRTCADFYIDDTKVERNYPYYFNDRSLLDTVKNNPTLGFLGNLQCCMLSGQPTFEAVLDVWDKENFIVGCFEYPQEFVNTCAMLLKWRCSNLPCRNVATDSTYQERIASEPGLVEFLTEHNQEDIKLYEYVKSKIVVNTVKPDFDLTPLYPDYKSE